MSENIIEKVKKFVEEECKKNPLGEEILIHHFTPVRNHAINLAKIKDADLEIVEIAAWLHDIGSIIYGRENHHITGAEIAEKKLREFGYPKEKIKRVKLCILNHRGSVEKILGSIEEKIIVEADSITFFDNFEGYFLWIIENQKLRNQKIIRESVKNKAQNKWNQLSPEGKALIKNKFEASMLLFG